MFLFRDVIDKQIVDCHDDKAGKVDDILLELCPGERPAVRAIVTGHGAAAAVLPGPIAWFVRWMERAVLGLDGIKPITIDWEYVTKIDVTVHLDLDRRRDRLTETEESVWRRWIKPLPWSQR